MAIELHNVGLDYCLAREGRRPSAVASSPRTSGEPAPARRTRGAAGAVAIAIALVAVLAGSLSSGWTVH
ncbi:MAG: hypothetical protein FWD12_10415 [Alphaproteobacteria bacterium]|nr:hypothetical protein [Alphaproteobacteria bacterium]